MRFEGLAVSVTVALLSAGCTSDGRPTPTVLSDGSPARPPPLEFQGVEGPVVAARLRLLPPGSVSPGSAHARCIDTAAPLRGVAVERIDVRGRTVSYLAANGRAAFGCDSFGDVSPAEDRWCGRAFGRMTQGRLHDPRLSLACQDDEGNAVGYAWVQPAAQAAYVVVAHAGYSESHRVTGAVPVRIRTEDVELASSSARFDVSEHAQDGRRLRTYELEAVVSG